MPGLFLECRHCGQSFPSRIGVNDAALHGVSMNGVTHRCPQCQHEDQYFTGDYFVPDATGKRAQADAEREQQAPTESHQSPAEVAARKLSGYGVGA